MSAPIHPTLLRALTQLALVYAHAWESEEQLAAYARAIADLPPEDVELACEEIARVERFWPRPVVIRAAVQQLQRSRATRVLGDRPLPDVEKDPETGAYVQLSSCRECWGDGWLPLYEGRLISRTEQHERALPRNLPHKRCTCQKYVEPRPLLVRPSFDRQQEDR